MNHIAVINKKPVMSGKKSTPDGAINGNGDLGIILGNSDNGLRIFISKCDIWQGIERYDTGGIRPLGCIDIEIPSNFYENYYVEQDMDKGELRCRFADADDVFELNTRVCKAENSIMIEYSGNINFEPELKFFEGQDNGEKGFFEDSDCKGIYRIFAGDEYEFETHIYSAIKKVCDCKYYISVATNFDVENPKEYVIEKTKKTDEAEYENLKKTHYTLWKDFWSKSSFELSDKILENDWYASQYFLACCAGNKNFPPGIFANFITVENPDWHGDYHLNYNYQASFYAVCSSNHVELTDCYHAPLEDFEEKGRLFAKRFNCGGVIYPVGIAPKGLCTELDKNNKYWFLRLFLGQKSNQLHPADIMVFRWKSTRDLDYAREHAYPYIKNCLEFFEDYAVLENGRLSVKKDAAHEVPYYKKDFDPKKYRRYINDTNNALTLGVLRLCIPAAIDMAKSLGIDEDKQQVWTEMLEKLSPFATCRRFFRKVYRYTEKGQRWNGNGDVGLQHIYPGCCVGLSSPEKELKIARNTFKMKSRYCWDDGNAVSSFFPMAAHLGIDPSTIIKKLYEHREKHILPNLLFIHGGGCLENCSIVANTLNEMALQSYEGIIRIFPVWDKNIDCKFKNLRADGAFLVSSEMKNGEIKNTEILSEKGSLLRLENPFEKVMINGTVYEEKIIEIPTVAGDRFTVVGLTNSVQ